VEFEFEGPQFGSVDVNYPRSRPRNALG